MVTTSRHQARLKVRDYLEKQLVSLRAGEPLPPIRTLMRESGASLARLNGILDDLEAQGLIERRPRQGIFKAADLRSGSTLEPFVGRSGGSATLTIGVILDSWPHGVNNAYLADLFRYLKRHLRRSPRPCRLVYEFVEAFGEEGVETPRLLTSPGIDGVIFMPFTRGGLEFLNGWRPASRPVVCFGRELRNDQVPQVYVDHRLGGAKAAEYLLQLGHRRICTVSSAMFEGSPDDLRLRGYRQVLERSGVPIDPNLTVEAENRYDQVNQRLARVFDRASSPTAVFVTGGVLMPAVLHALASLGKTVPADLSLLSYDDTEESRTYHPPITVVRQPLDQAMGVLLNEMLNWIEGGHDGRRRVMLPPELVVRESCAPVRETDNAPN